MAFKIESIEKMNEIANTMTTYANEANSESLKVVTAVDELVGIISGKGVGTELQNLREIVIINTQSAVQVLNEVSTFIRTQVSSYSSTEETAKSALSNVQSTLDGIQI